MSNVDDQKPEQPYQKQTTAMTEQQLKRQYEKYIKRIDVRSKMVEQLLTQNNQVSYLTRPSVERFKHPPYPSFGMRFNRISMGKQLQYLKSTEKVTQGTAKIITQCINADYNGLIKKKRNRAIILPNGSAMRYVYSHKEQLKLLDMEMSAYKTTLTQSQNFGKSLQRKIYEVGKQQRWVWARTLYSLQMFQASGQLSFSCPFDSELINVNFNPFKKEQLFVSVHDVKSTVKKFANMQDKQASEEFICDDFVKSLKNIDINTLIMATSNNKIQLLDTKANRQSVLCESKQNLYELVWLRSEYRNTPYYVVSNTFRLEVFDIRNTNKPVVNVKHLSEECPPSILQVFMGNPRPQSLVDKFKQEIRKLEHPVILAHSPYHQGNCMMMRFGEANEPTVTKDNYIGSLLSEECNNVANSGYPLLLFDSGKIVSQAKPASINPILIARDRLAVLQTDSCGGVSLQAFQIKSLNNNSNRTFLYDNIPLQPKGSIVNAKSLKSLNEERLINLQTEKYLEHASSVKVEEGENTNQDLYYRRGVVERKKTLIANMRQFYEWLYTQSKHEDVSLHQTKKNTDYINTMDTVGYASQQLHDSASQFQPRQDEIGTTDMVNQLAKLLEDDIVGEYQSNII